MIQCNDVIKIYEIPDTKMKVAALRGIDLDIGKGEVVSIIGPSGSGKSSLINILAGIEPISSGEVKVNSLDIGKMSSNELMDYRLRTVGLVQQFPERNLFLSGTVKDNLEFSSSLNSIDISNNKIFIKEVVEKLGIAHLQNRKVSLLSGGEMIRTAIACMLAKRAPLLLCDEPTGQLDSQNTENVKSLLHQISRDYNTTILVVTHDLRFLTGVDRTCEIHSGRVSSLYSVNEDPIFAERKFPLKLNSQIDSSQSVRIPDEVYGLLQLKSNLQFIITEDSKVELKHPEGVLPKKIRIKQTKRLKVLEIQPFPENYNNNKEIEIAFQDVSKIYENKAVKVNALNNVNVNFYKNELTFIIGPSGSGKTTFIKLITGLEASTSGKISAFTNELSNFKDKERAKFRRKYIGIVPQQGDLHPYIKIKENLFLKDILSWKNINLQKYPEVELDNVFKAFQINHKKDSFPLEVSGGELQRASLAIAQYGSPRLLILDEPTANMDAELAEKVMTQLYEIHIRFKITTIITTHDINLVKDGTRVIDLKDGRINKDGLAYAIVK